MKTILITGGSSGIGLAISKYFAQNGFAICWVSLFEEEILIAQKALLAEYPNTSIHYCVQDLSKADGVTQTYEWCKSNSLSIDVLVNNAGFGTFGFADTIDLAQEVRMIHLNILGVFKLTRMFLKDMLEKNSGTIINMSSSSAFQPVPKMAAYSATKAFVKQYSESLSEELKTLGSKVKVMAVCPAAIKDTKFKEAAKMTKVKTFEGLAATSTNEVAKDVWHAYQKNQSLVVTGAKLRSLMLLSKLLPSSVVQYLVRDELSEQS
ncbi:MAG: SDR family NAD(P)-dependent oxidoreductase [Bacteroidota bacterium]